MTTFLDLGVPARLADALAADGITEPFPVQSATLPEGLAGKDLCGRAPTGSGKTLGFGIPLMVRVSQAKPNRPTGLVLVPTRELAEQVQRALVPLGRAQWRFIQAIYGGASIGPQIHSLRKGASVVVATPGRLLDLIEQGHCDLGAVEVCVIDEADRMADLGFMPDVRRILDMTPRERQTMLWSATLDGDVDELIRDYMNDPVRHDLIDDTEAAPVEHRFVVTRPTERLDAAAALIEEHGPTVVFVKTRFGVDDVAAELNRAGVTAGALHGARSQALRQRTLEDFKRGRVQALVATDVAARGIHIDNVSLVLHYDMPDNDKDYTHRSGRTGRAGNAGLVIAFVPPSRQRIAQRMSDAVTADITWERQATSPDRREQTGSNWTPRPRRDDDRPRFTRDDQRRPGGPRPDRRDERPRIDRSPNDWRPERRDERPRTDRPYSDRPYSDRPRTDGARTDRPRTDRPYSDRPRTDGPRADRPRSDRPYSNGPRTDRPYSDRPRSDRPYANGPRTDRPYSDRPRSDRPYSDRPRADGPRTDRPYSDRPSSARPRADGPRTDRPYSDRPRSDRPYSDRPRADGPRTDRPYSERQRSDRPYSDRARTDRPSSDRPRSDQPGSRAGRNAARDSRSR